MGQIGRCVRAGMRSYTVPTYLTYPAYLAHPPYFTDTVHDTDAFSGG